MHTATTCAQLATRIRDVFLQGTWIANTNYRQALSTITLAQALHTSGGHNSIAALTYHVDYYLSGVLHCLQGGPLLLSDAQSFLLPPLTTEADWQALKSRLLTHAEAFATTLEAQPDSFLATPFTNPRYGSWQHNIEGLIEHSYYHLGQVVLISKLLEP